MLSGVAKPYSLLSRRASERKAKFQVTFLGTHLWGVVSYLAQSRMTKGVGEKESLRLLMTMESIVLSQRKFVKLRNITESF
jgi:hypothetical protein